ncbi:hypothetical protein LTR33_007944 [Friedmanniomyces endolithicus]|nr:hypothetical protein LTR33_007944 [Friedmanniomyces endolithicus]
MATTTEGSHEPATWLPAPPPFHQQENSRLMQLPPEIRDLIYAFIFRSTRFSYGKRGPGQIDGYCVVISGNRGNALSLLRTCRRVNAEIGNQWVSQVVFSFEDPCTLLDKLAGISDTVRSLIRNVRTSGDTLRILWGHSVVYYRTAQILKMLPCLNLDKLTVLGSPPGQVSYETIDMLIRYSDGWKELHFISFDSEILGYAYTSDPSARDRDVYLRQPQPATWQKALEQRDGVASCPSVIVYRSMDSTPCSLLDPSKRTTFNQHYGVDQSSPTYGNVEDAELMAAGERTKELSVIVKRGSGIDYAERQHPSLLTGDDIRKESTAQTWKEVKAVSRSNCSYYCDEADCWHLGDITDNAQIVDSYRHVDEYTWPLWYHQVQQVQQCDVS